MSEELQQQEQQQEEGSEQQQNEEASQEETSQEATPQQSTKWENAAREQGWVPKEEWTGDPEDWTDAKEYVRRGELFGKIDHQRSEIRELRKAITQLTEHHNKVKETEYNRALEYLKQQKKTALEEGDADKLLQVDDAIDILKQERQQERQTQTQAQNNAPSRHFETWVQQNSWYLQDPELRAFADDVGVGAYQRSGGKIGEEELYNLVKQRVMKQFPEKFRGKAPRSSAVEGAGTETKPSKPDSFKLTEQEERAMKTFVRQGIMTKEDYIKEIKRVRGAA